MITMMYRLNATMSSDTSADTPANMTVRDIVHRTILNPYKTLKKILVNTSTSASKTVTYTPKHGKHNILTSLADNKCWGDSLQSKQDGSTRIYFQNINGLSTKDHSKWLHTLSWLKDNNVDIAGLAEPCINTNDIRVLNSYSSKISMFQNRSFIKFSHNHSPSESKYQPGGSLILCSAQWKSRIVNIIQDQKKWGRYVGLTFRLKQDKYLTVISSYRCVKRFSTSVGNKTSVRYQRDCINKLGLTTSVRKLCLEDISNEISNVKLKYGEESGVIVMIDANESLTDLHSQITDFLRTNNLIDTIPSYNELPASIATQERSTTNRRIDFIFS
jgi:hypothetical protein